MLYEDLYGHYGLHVAQRIKRELTASEFNAVSVEDLPRWLERRADDAHDSYLYLLENPVMLSETELARTGEACRRWREAEDLAYLVAIAEDVGKNARRVG